MSFHHEAAQPPVQVAPAADVGGGSQTILLAEDDGAVRRLARDILANQGYRVLDARDGDEALAIARRYPNVIHLLVTDVVMPGLSGRDLAVRLTVERPQRPRGLHQRLHGKRDDALRLREWPDTARQALPGYGSPAEGERNARDDGLTLCVLDRPDGAVAGVAASAANHARIDAGCISVGHSKGVDG